MPLKRKSKKINLKMIENDLKKLKALDIIKNILKPTKVYKDLNEIDQFELIKYVCSI